MATTPGQWPLAFSVKGQEVSSRARLVHLGYDLVSGIVVIWLPNQDSGLFGKR
jgi:hypothetical protein